MRFYLVLYLFISFVNYFVNSFGNIFDTIIYISIILIKNQGMGAILLALLHARRKRCTMNDNEFLETLEGTKLSKANSKRSKKLFIMRKILIDKYINKMSREEICAELDFISLSTYTDYLKQAKKVISCHP